MKVLFLTNVPSPYRVDFFNELGKLCDLTVLYELKYATDRNGNWKGNNAENFNEIFLRGKRINYDSALCFSVIKHLRDKSYDIIVVGGYSTPTGMLAIEYLKLKGIKFIISCDGGIIKEDNRLKYAIKKHYMGSATAWLSTGLNTSEYLLNYGARKNKIFTYPFTSLKDEDIIDKILSNDKKQSIRNDLGMKEKYIIISVGQFIHRKGFDILIKSMKELSSNVGVYIVGGEPTDEYKKLKEEYKLDNLHFEGFKTKEELVMYYKAANMFVLPTREDIWGLVINEAMATGLPVITTDKCVAGMELIIEGENGYIVPIDDINKLAVAINKIINNENIMLSMANNNLMKIKDYTISKMAIEHFKIFENILNLNKITSKD